MTDVEGILCITCKSTFGTWGHSKHHQRYCDLVVSKDAGCFTCTWVWSTHPPRPTEGNSAEDAGERFTVTCLLRSNFGAYHVTFGVTCSWAAPYEISVQLSNRDEYEGIPHHRQPIPIHRNDILARPWSRLDPYIGSSQSLETIQSWISTCKEQNYCKFPYTAQSYFPARAIDVQETSSGMVFLRDRDEVISRYGTSEEGSCRHDTPEVQQYPDYWTLSHRWGDPNRTTQLSKETEHQLRGGISPDSLSPTFRDAVLLVHRLGYKYLWIDSLCIFQDSENDWQREANTMVDVYRHSFCNISAISSSVDPSLGLFRYRTDNARFLYPFITDIGLPKPHSSELKYGPWIAWNGSTWFDEIERAPLHTRGWVVQERFLSDRTIHFTRNQMYWECVGGTYCEADLMIGLANYMNPHWNSYARRKSKFGYKATRRVFAQAQATQTFRLKEYNWLTILSTYLSSTLTKDSDRLIAMSGIAKSFQELNGDAYLAGLWKRDIRYGLLWKTKATGGIQVRCNASYAPSWSWASVAAMGTGTSVELCVHGWDENVNPAVKPLMRLIDERIVAEPPDGDTTGLLRSAELDIECRFFYFRWLKQSGSLEIYTDEARTQCYGRFKSPLTIPCVYFDMSDRVEEFAKAEVVEGTCMPICKVDAEDMLGFYALILESPGDDKFQRTGILQYMFDTLGSYKLEDLPDHLKAWWNEWDIDNWPGLSRITLI